MYIENIFNYNLWWALHLKKHKFSQEHLLWRPECLLHWWNACKYKKTQYVKCVRFSKSRQYFIHKIKPRLEYFPLSCLHITITTHSFCAWMLSFLLSIEILIDCGTYKYFIWKTLDFHLIKTTVWFCPSAAFSFMQVFSIICRHKWNKNLKNAFNCNFYTCFDVNLQYCSTPKVLFHQMG